MAEKAKRNEDFPDENLNRTPYPEGTDFSFLRHNEKTVLEISLKQIEKNIELFEKERDEVIAELKRREEEGKE